MSLAHGTALLRCSPLRFRQACNDEVVSSNSGQMREREPLILATYLDLRPANGYSAIC